MRRERAPPRAPPLLEQEELLRRVGHEPHDRPVAQQHDREGGERAARRGGVGAGDSDAPAHRAVGAGEREVEAVRVNVALRAQGLEVNKPSPLIS